MIKRHSKLLDKPGFIKYYNEQLQHRIMTIGFLKDVDYGSLAETQFIEFVTGGSVYFASHNDRKILLGKFQIVLDQISEKYPYIDIEMSEKVKNVQRVTIVLKTHIMSHGIDFNKRNIAKEMQQYNIIEKIIMFCHVNGLQIV